MKASKLKATGALVLAAAMLLSGCSRVKEEPPVELASLKVADETSFYAALSEIDITEADTNVMENTAFKFTNSDAQFEVIISIDTKSDIGNVYSYTRCKDETTARALFDYYFYTYSPVLESDDFAGAKGYKVLENHAYLLISGVCDNMPYHDALYLLGDTVVVAFEGAGDPANKKEIDTFLESLGYPAP